MTLNQYFDFKRFGHLLKREGYNNYKLFGIALGGISGIILIIFLIAAYSWHEDGETIWDFHFIFFIVTYVIIGVAFTSLAYKDLLQVNKAYAYLTLPVSNLERFFSMFLLTTVVYTAFYLLYYWVFSMLLNGLGMLYTDLEFTAFDFTQYPVVQTIKLYLVLQSIFLLGAAAFKKFPFLFTMLTIFVAAVTLIIISATTARIVFADFISDKTNIDLSLGISDDFQKFLEEDLVKILRSVFWYVLAPVCWVLTYLKLKEREV